MKKYHLLAFTLLFLFVIFSTNANNLAIPTLNKRITDLTQTLTPEELDKLNTQIITFENSHPDGSQLAILIIPHLSNTTIDEQANLIFNDWQLGQKGKDNGVLLLIALEDRELKIEVGYGLEGQLTDLRTHRIMEQYLIPAFKTEQYYQGISDAIKAIDSIITDPVNNLFADDEKMQETYNYLVELAGINALIIMFCTLMGYVIQPTNSLIKSAKRYIILWLIGCTGCFTYLFIDSSFLLIDLIKTGLFLSGFTLLFSLMISFVFAMLHGFIVVPFLNLFVSTKIDKNNKIIKPQINIRVSVAVTLACLAIFAVLPTPFKLIFALIGFIICGFTLSKNGRSSGSSSRNSSSIGRGGGGGFSGGGGRSGGGGSSGRW
ncbi:TPM domain-containing protein [Orbus mooreae]|uniref:TPM domain-containing protein n=1 Tax=Orbus mooreae TaxID=3074107 RepID=UPI00370D6157